MNSNNRITNSNLVILNESEGSPFYLIHKAWRFFTSFRMTKKSDCHFESAYGGEKSLESVPFALTISPTDLIGKTEFQNDILLSGKLSLFNKGLKLILLVSLMLFVLTPASYAQNIMQVDDADGTINSNVTVSLSVQNDEEFISFQCDLLLPDGFKYVAGSVSLTPRSVDHVVNVTNIENNIIRILSYSLNNTAFLLDSGVVARVGLSTPETEGDYSIGTENGIIGNAQSVNILDSLINGEINLGPIGISENNILENKINCFPNPFNENLTIHFDIGNPELINLLVFDVDGTLLSNHNLNSVGIDDLTIDTKSLLGMNASNGTYVLLFSLQDKNQIYSIVKKIQLKK